MANSVDPFTEDDRRFIVAVREHDRWLIRQPPSRWLIAIHEDRRSKEFARDPDAINPPSRAYLLKHGRSVAPGETG